MVPVNKFNNGGKDLYLDNYKILKKEIEYSNKWKYMHVLYSWIRRISIIKISILPKTIDRFNTIPTQILMAYLIELGQIFQNLYETMKDPK